MYMPILVAVATMLIYPSMVLAFLLAMGTWAYLRYAGRKVDPAARASIEGKLAFRVLSVKFLAMNGEMDDAAFETHGHSTVDEPENSALRADLRDVASRTADGWQDAARRIARVYKDEPESRFNRLNLLIVQLTSQPGSRQIQNGFRHLPDEVQDNLIRVAKLWKIGPKRFRELLADNQVAPSQAASTWR